MAGKSVHIAAGLRPRPGKAAGQGCRARLPGKAAGQGCRARLPGKAAGQGCRARMPGKAAGQGCRASCRARLKAARMTYITISELADHPLFKMVRHVLLRPLRPELDGQDVEAIILRSSLVQKLGTVSE
jgi:hypothetical protein